MILLSLALLYIYIDPPLIFHFKQPINIKIKLMKSAIPQLSSLNPQQTCQGRLQHNQLRRPIILQCGTPDMPAV